MIPTAEGMTVAELKLRVVAALGKKAAKAPIETQVLSYRGTVFHDDKTLRHYQVKDGQMIVPPAESRRCLIGPDVAAFLQRTPQTVQRRKNHPKRSSSRRARVGRRY